jgi:NadR type nicotinamide-nucleotide adenylyltransferase
MAEIAPDKPTSDRGVGLILGKFLPPHAGHQFLVHFGRQFASRLHLLVCTLESESIPGHLRYKWMCELFPDVHVVHIDANLPQDPHDHPDFWPIWRAVCQRAAGEPIDFVFASETYGARLAAELGATFVPVDPARSHIPISGTAIRSDPLAHWEFIPTCVRPFFVKRVCLFGPESTGKSTLALALARHYGTVSVPEFARGWLDPKRGVCAAEDIPIIARGQIAAEEALARQANRVLICDTDLLLTTIWSDVLFGQCEDWIRREAFGRSYDLYLLLDIDIPWIDDAQRYLPHARGEFFDRCEALLLAQARRYIVIRGSFSERFSAACRAVDAVLAEARRLLD